MAQEFEQQSIKCLNPVQPRRTKLLLVTFEKKISRDHRKIQYD